MKRFVWLIMIVLVWSIVGCATYPNRCSEEELLVIKAGVYQTKLMMQEMKDCKKVSKVEIPCLGEKTVYQEKIVTIPAPMEKETAYIPAAKPETVEYTPGESWVFRWERAEQGYIWVMTNPKYLNAQPDPSRNEGIYFVGDGQGWFTKQYPMQLIDGEYRVKLPVSKFMGRNRCNYVMMNNSPEGGIWGLFGPADDKVWVKEGDYDAATDQYKYCIIFSVDSDGTVVPSE